MWNITAASSSNLHQTDRKIINTGVTNIMEYHTMKNTLSKNHYVFTHQLQCRTGALSFSVACKLNESGYLRLSFGVWQPQPLCSRGLGILVLSVKMLIKYDCSDTFACLRKPEEREKKRGEWERQETGQVRTWKQWLRILSCLNLQQLGIYTMRANNQLMHAEGWAVAAVWLLPNLLPHSSFGDDVRETWI